MYLSSFQDSLHGPLSTPWLFIIFSHLLTFQGIGFQGLIGEGILPPQGIMSSEARSAARQLADLRVESHWGEKNG